MTDKIKQSEWEEIARMVLHDPKASRSEVSCALTGITRSTDTTLRELLEKKLKTAWKAEV
jgi:hypothetical protein